MLVKHLLINNKIEIKKIENNKLIGIYKKFGIIVKCLFKQGCYMIMENEIVKFEKEFNDSGEKIGFLMSNVYFSDKAIERTIRNDKIYLCHENELVDTIKNVEKYKSNELKEMIEDLEFFLDLQKDIIQHQEKLIKRIKEF
jgi:hypothetical protein